MENFQGQILLASAKLQDPNFVQAVIFMIQHNAEGALGLVLNRPTTMTLAKAWEQVDDTQNVAHETYIHHGGPCEGPLMVLHTDPANSEQQIHPGIHFATQEDQVREVVLSGSEPAKFFLGYAGWGPEQLEAEMREEAWTVVGDASDSMLDVIFRTEEDTWLRLTRQLAARTLLPDINPSSIPRDPSMN